MQAASTSMFHAIINYLRGKLVF